MVSVCGHRGNTSHASGIETVTERLIFWILSVQRETWLYRNSGSTDSGGTVCFLTLENKVCALLLFLSKTAALCYICSVFFYRCHNEPVIFHYFPPCRFFLTVISFFLVGAMVLIARALLLNLSISSVAESERETGEQEELSWVNQWEMFTHFIYPWNE